MASLQGHAAVTSRRVMLLAMLGLAGSLALALGVGGNARMAPASSPAAKEDAKNAYGKLPLSFVPNAGQTDSHVRYSAQAGSRSFFFTPDKAVLSFAGKKRGMALDLRFLSASPQAKLLAQRPQKGTVNYLTGARHHTGLHTYGQVTYRELWPGVDMSFRGAGGQLKYEFLVRPGARVSDIGLAYAGASGLSVTEAGALSIQTPLGTLNDAAPRTYQRIGGRKVAVDSRFNLERASGKNAYGFTVGNYDRNRPLVIDPGVVYSTYLGGNDNDGGLGTIGVDIAVDGQGYAYVTGETSSSNFPTTPGAFDSTSGGNDMFVTKIDPTGSTLVYSTYIGGVGEDEVRGIAIDGAKNAYVSGSTGSPDFPITPGAYDPVFTPGGQELFVTKLNPAGSALVYSTFVGGSSNDYGEAIAVDDAGRAYLTGQTQSTDFPTTIGAYDGSANGGVWDGFVTKLNATGSTLDYSTYLGGSGYSEAGMSIAVDGGGSAYVAGYSESGNFPTTAGAYDTTQNGGIDAFVTKLNPGGSALSYSTFLGGPSGEFGWAIALDGAGSAFVTGRTFGAFPVTPGAYTSSQTGYGEVFVTKLNPSGSSLGYSAMLGGSDADYGLGIAADSAGSAYVIGETFSSDFPTTPDAFDTTFNGPIDDFVTKLSPTGSSLVYSTMLGGSDYEGHDAEVVLQGRGNVYVVGQTESTDFPTTPGAYDTTFNGGTYDVYVTKFSFPPPYNVPQSAPQLAMSLVPTFKPCGTGGNPVNAGHAPPLSVGSCNPPRPGGVARIGAQSTLSGDLTAVPGDQIPSNGDQADVTVDVNMSDITTDTGSDYTPNSIGPDMTLYMRLRFTDLDNGVSGQPGTAGDFDFAAPIECTATPSSTVGSDCSAITSADAITPGLIKEDKSTVLQTFRLRVNDSGLDGIRGNSDDAIFATQGVFVP